MNEAGLAGLAGSRPHGHYVLATLVDVIPFNFILPSSSTLLNKCIFVILLFLTGSIKWFHILDHFCVPVECFIIKH